MKLSFVRHHLAVVVLIVTADFAAAVTPRVSATPTRAGKVAAKASAPGAASTSLHATSDKSVTLDGDAAAFGGRAGEPINFSDIALEAVRERERIDLSFAATDSAQVGATGGVGRRAQKGEPGYFHIQLDQGGRRAIIDLSDVTHADFDEAKMRRVLLKSRFIRTADMTFDPVDSATKIVLLMQTPTRLVVQTHADQRRITIEVTKSGSRH
jgi:hypothetical protein